MPTKLTQRADTFAVIGAILWIAAALGAIPRAGETSESDWKTGYLIEVLLVFAAASCFTVLIFGLLRRTDAGRGWLSIGARVLAILGTILLPIAIWMWIVFTPLFAVAALVAVLRLRARALGSALFQWFLVAAWPVGIGVGLLLTVLEVGPVNSYGDHEAGIIIGFAIGSLLFAAGLAMCGLWLRSEKSIDAPLN